MSKQREVKGFKIVEDPQDIFTVRVRNLELKKYGGAGNQKRFSSAKFDAPKRKNALAAANDWGTKRALMLARGGEIEANRSQRLLLTSEVIALYFEDCEVRRLAKNTIVCRKYNLESLIQECPVWNHKDILSQLDAWWTMCKLKRVRSGPKEGELLKPKATNHFLEDLKCMNNRLPFIKKLNIEEAHNLNKMTKLTDPGHDKAIFSVAELRQLLAYNDYYSIRAALYIYTGGRAREILRLRWQDIQPELGYLKLRANKRQGEGDNVRSTRLMVELIPYLDKWKAEGHCYPGMHSDKKKLLKGEDEQDYLFPPQQQWMASSCINTAFDRFLRLADIPKRGRTTHSFRHTYGAIMTAANEPTNMLMNCMGHATNKMSMHYSKHAIEYSKLISDEKWPTGIMQLQPKIPTLKAKNIQMPNPDFFCDEVKQARLKRG